MKPIEALLIKYPDIEIVDVRHDLDQETFNAQKQKHQSRNAEGGAIGTVWLDDNTFILTKRSGLHAGWALIGGTVEQGESFDIAFVREIEEETGLKASISRVLQYERKIFVAPSGEELEMDVVLMEAKALKSQEVRKTIDAEEEGLIIEAFSKKTVPAEMILKDRQKLDVIIRTNIK